MTEEAWSDMKASLLKIDKMAGDFHNRPLGISFDEGHGHHMVYLDPPKLSLKQRLSVLIFG